MARPKKTKLDYFPFDVDIFEDEKLFDVQNEYGPLGEVIYFRLLCLIYKNGYYYEFGSMDKLAGIVIRSIGNRWTRNKQTVIEVISLLAKNNLFSAELMQRNILTSRGIQRRYLKALERNQPEITKYSLLEKEDIREGFKSVPKNLVSATKTNIFVAETSDKVNKNATKERKENKSKENNMSSSRARSLLSDGQYKELVSLSSESVVNTYLEKADSWLSKGKGYRDMFFTIKQWISEDRHKEQSKPSYSTEEWQEMAEGLDPNKIPFEEG